MSLSPAQTKLVTGLTLAVALVAGDQFSKQVFMGLLLDPPRAIPLTGFFNLVPVWNKGVSFGMFAGHDGWGAWVLAVFALIVAAMLVRWLAQAERRLTVYALGAVIGGAIGNVIDRLRFGAVFDFLDFYIGAWHWPAFNVADIAIVVGVGGLVLDTLISGKRDAK